jgi:hypothetical protein
MTPRQIENIKMMYGQRGLGRGLAELGYDGAPDSVFDDAVEADALQVIVDREVARVESLNVRARNAYRARLDEAEKRVAAFDKARADYGKNVLPKRAALVEKMIAALAEVDKAGVFGTEIADFIRARATEELDVQEGEGIARRLLDNVREHEPKPYADPEANEYGDEKHVPNAMAYLEAVIEVKRKDKAARVAALRAQLAEVGLV